MTEQLEQQLRQLFAEDAKRAPATEALADGVRRRARRRRLLQLAWTAGGVAASVAVVAVAGGMVGGTPAGDKPEAPPAAAPQVSGRTGPLPDGGAASCVEQYDLTTVTGRAFAFDGTVTDVAPASNGQTTMGGGLVSATFTVNEWFAGGSGRSVTVEITSPEAAPTTVESAPAYAVGSRLLVSGEPRWGGAPLADAIAWGCGFTRYYDESTAADWRDAFG